MGGGNLVLHNATLSPTSLIISLFNPSNPPFVFLTYSQSLYKVLTPIPFQPPPTSLIPLSKLVLFPLILTLPGSQWCTAINPLHPTPMCFSPFPVLSYNMLNTFMWVYEPNDVQAHDCQPGHKLVVQWSVRTSHQCKSHYNHRDCGGTSV